MWSKIDTEKDQFSQLTEEPTLVDKCHIVVFSVKPFFATFKTHVSKSPSFLFDPPLSSLLSSQKI